MEGGIKEGKLHGKKSLERRHKRRDCRKRAEAKYKNQSVKKNMNVENRRSKIEERMEGEKVKGRTRKKGCCVPKPYCQSVTCMFAGA